MSDKPEFPPMPPGTVGMVAIDVLERLGLKDQYVQLMIAAHERAEKNAPPHPSMMLHELLQKLQALDDQLEVPMLRVSEEDLDNVEPESVEADCIRSILHWYRLFCHGWIDGLSFYQVQKGYLRTMKSERKHPKSRGKVRNKPWRPGLRPDHDEP